MAQQVAIYKMQQGSG